MLPVNRERPQSGADAPGGVGDTTYDGLDRKKTVSNPHRSTAAATDGISTFEYDALSRVTKVIPPDGSPATNHVSTVYSGNTTTVTDQAGKKRKSETDALGRLTRVWEPDPGGSLIYETAYQYDALDNLTRVDQKGNDPNSANWRTRTFTYNSLSQLVSATNPESGSASYSYDSDGNLVSKTDARGISITYAYDAPHRLTSKNYSDTTVNPDVAYFYDQPNPWGGSVTNYLGRLTSEYTYGPGGTTQTSAKFSYDPMGRVLAHGQCTPLNCAGNGFYTTYTYDLMGNVTSATNGAGVTISYAYNGAGQPTTVTSSLVDAQHPGTLVSGISYTPAGGISQMTYGNGLVETRAYNNRLQPTEMRSYNPSTGADILKLNYGFNFGTANNGNLMSWSAAGAQSFSRTYTYDELNRVKTMADSNPAQACRGLTWNYDIWGNRRDQTTTGGSCPEHHPTILASNRIAELGYDAAGNVTTNAGTTYQYDAENRLISVNGGAVASYVYDAHGRRVEKIAGSTQTHYLYDLAGNVVAEKDQNNIWNVGYVYLEGEMVAQYRYGTTYFTHKDHLGSTRVLSKVDKTVYQSYDYMPFGEEPSGGTATTHKFTGKERDPESRLDYFGSRYYSGSLGRFLSTDVGPPIFLSPQSWNRYSYVLNNPLRFIDPDGERAVKFYMVAFTVTYYQYDARGNLIGITKVNVKVFITLVIEDDGALTWVFSGARAANAPGNNPAYSNAQLSVVAQTVERLFRQSFFKQFPKLQDKRQELATALAAQESTLGVKAVVHPAKTGQPT